MYRGQRGRLTVKQTLCDVGGELVVVPLKTEATERIVFESDPLPEMLSTVASTAGTRLRGGKVGRPRGYPAVMVGLGGRCSAT